MNHDLTLTKNLMERICESGNLRSAFLKVKSNKGAAGIDRMTVDELHHWAQKNIESLKKSLLDASYQPMEILGVPIPKSNGGTRMLGIPTVIDRLVQQAILQVLQPIFDPSFSEFSFGFRPGRSQHMALLKAKSYVDGGHNQVVDMDLEQFFDRVNHDILMSRLARRIGDKRLLLVIRRFLSVGMMSKGIVNQRDEGVPQGSPLSPLLSNILLDDLDKELEKRGHSFVRFADDCNIYVRSSIAAERVLVSITTWLWKNLRLKVNTMKSAASYVGKRKFLGYTMVKNQLRVAPQSIDTLKNKIRKLTARRNPQTIEDRISKLNQLFIGWTNYFRLADVRKKLSDLDQWVRRRIRCLRLHQLKRTYSRVVFLKSLGVSSKAAWMTMLSGKGIWRLGNTPAANIGMNLKWFEDLGLVSLEKRYLKLKGV